MRAPQPALNSGGLTEIRDGAARPIFIQGGSVRPVARISPTHSAAFRAPENVGENANASIPVLVTGVG